MRISFQDSSRFDPLFLTTNTMKCFVCLVFLCLTAASFNMTVGYLQRSSIADDEVKCQLLKNYTYDELLEKTDGEINVEIDCKEYEYDVEDIKAKLEEYNRNNISLIYTFCEDVILSEEIEEYLGKCTRRYIMGNTLVTIIETMAYIMSTRGNEGVGFIGDNRTLDEFYQTRVIKASYYYGQKEIGSYHHQYINESILDEYLKNTKKFGKNVVTYWSSKDNFAYDKFLKLKNDTYGLNNEDYPVVVLDGSLVSQTLNNPTSIPVRNKGNYHMRGYDGSFNNTENKKYQKYKVGRVPTAPYDEVYALGIMNMLIYGLQKLQTTKIYDLISILYKRSIPYAGGELTLLDNHYIVAPHFAFEFIGDGFKAVKKYTIQPKFTFEPDQIMGQNVNMTCNFTLNKDTGLSDYNSISIMFIQHVDGERNVENRYVRSFLSFLVNMVNSAGGIRGQPVKQLFVNIEDDIEDTADIIRQNIDLYNCHTGLLICSSTERQQLSDLLKDEDFQFIYLSGNEGDVCQKNVIYANPIVANYLECLINYLDEVDKNRNNNNNNKRDVAVISSGDLFGRKSQEILLKKLEENGYDIENISGSLIVSTDSTAIDYIIDTVVNNLKSNDNSGNNDNDGGVIIITASQAYQIPLFRRLVYKGIVNDTKYEVISLLFNEALAEPIGIENVENVTYLAHYYYDHSKLDDLDEVSDIRQLDMVYAFSKYMSEQLNTTSFPFFNTMGILVNIFNLWAQVIAIRSYVKPSQYLSYMYHYPLPNPVMGPYEIYYSGEALTLLRVLKIVNGQSVLVYEDSYSRSENTFSNGTLVCDWKKYPDKGVSKYDFYYIGALFPLSTPSGKQRLESIQLAVDIINQDGGINGKDLVILKTEYDGDISTIAEIYEEAVTTYENILCFIGTDSLDERKAVYEMTKKYQKLIFVISLSQGEFSYSTIIQMASVTNQVLDIPLYFSYDKFVEIGIVYENNGVGKHRNEYILKLAEFLNKPIRFSYSTDTNNTMQNFTEFLLNDNLLKYKQMVVFTLISTRRVLEEFAEAYSDTVTGENKTSYPLFIMDYSTEEFIEDYFIGHFGAMLYNQQSDYVRNVELKQKIQQFKGSVKLLRTEFIFAYDTLLFLKEAVPKSADILAENLRNQLYLLDIDCPDGKKKITTVNFITTHLTFVQYNGSRVFIPIMTSDMPLMPKPYNFLNNDLKYYTVSYAAGSSQKLEETDPIKIAFFLELTGGGFVKYVMALNSIERMNYDGGVNNHEIVSEVYQCPTLEEDASSMIVTLYGRGFRVFVGGCDQVTREAMQPTIEALNLLFVYTGFNEGKDCSKNTVYLYVSPSQDIMPYMLHLLQKEPLKDFVFIHSNMERYNTRISMLQSVFTAFNVTLKHKGMLLVNETEEYIRIQIVGQCRIIERVLPEGGIIITLLTGIYPELFFEEFYKYFSYLGSSYEISNIYTIYVIENTHRKWNVEYAAGHYMYSADMLDLSEPLNVEFRDFYLSLTAGTLPTYSDVLVYDATKWCLELFSKLADYHDTTEMLKTIYNFNIKSVMGDIRVDSGNHVAQTVFCGRISNITGETVLMDYVSRDWRGETYRVALNREEYIICDWKTKMVDAESQPFIRVGIVVSSERQYLQQSVLFYESVYSSSVYNNERGGINGVTVNTYVISSGNDEETAYNRLKDHALYFDMFLFLGGFTTEIREGLHKACVETDSLIFYPTDYEGNECHQNGFYGGIGYPTYYTLVPTIMKLSPGNVIILYSDTTHSNYYAEKLKYDLITFNINLKLFLQFPLENEEMFSTVEYIQRLSPDGALVVSILEGTSKMSFLQALYDSGLNNKFTTLNLNMDDLEMYNLGEASVGSYYYDTFVEDTSVELYRNVKSLFQSLFAYIPVINRGISRGFLLNNMMYNSVRYAGVDFRKIKDALYDYEFDTLLGKLRFNLNNRFSMKMYLKRGSRNYISNNNENNNNNNNYVIGYEIVEQTSFAIPQKAYGNVLEDHEPVKECDLRYNQTIIEVETKKIVLVFATSGIYKKPHEKALLGAITALRELYDDEEKLLDKRLLVKFINYDSDIDRLQQTLNELKKDDDVVAYIGCTSQICKNMVQKVAVETNKLYYFPRITAGEECDYYTFYTSMVANQYITRLMEFLLTSKFKNDYYILTQNDISSNNLVTMIRGEASGLINEKGEFIYDVETSQITYDLFEDIQSKMNEGGIIISTFVSIEVFKNFMEYFNRLNIDTDKFAVVDLFLEVEETDTIPAEDRKDIYKIVRYSYDLPTEENKKFKNKALDYVSLDQPTSLFEAAYSAVHLYAQAVIRANSFETEKVRKGSYGASFQVGSGIITMNDNNYVTAPFFVIRYNKDGLTYQTIYSKYDVQSGSPWNWNIPTSYGYQCSFSDRPPEVGYKYKVPARKVALVAALSTSKNAEGYVDIYQMVINEINDKGGIGGYTLKGDIFDTEGNPALCKQYIEPYIRENHPIALFGAIDNACLKEIESEIPEENELIFFRLLSIELNECDAPYFISVKHATLYDKILDVIRNRFYEQIMVFIEDNDNSDENNGDNDYNAKYVIKYLKNMKIDDVSEFRYEMNNIEYSKTLLREKISQLTMLYNQNNNNKHSVCILFFGYENSFSDLLTIIDEETSNKNGNEGNKVSPFNVIIMENSQHMRKLFYYNYEYMEFYNPDDTSDINMEFKNKLYQRIDNDVYVSDIMIRTYSSIKLWQIALDSLPKNKKEENIDVANLERNNVRIALRRVQYDSPEGLVYFSGNQYLSRIPKLLKFNQNKTSTLIYDSTEAIVPEAFEPVNGVFKKCDFDDDNIDDGNTVPTYTILIMLSLTGTDREIETPIFDSLIAAIGDINRNGLLLDNYINYTVIDTKSSDDIYESELLKLVNNTRYTYIFGGYKPSTLERIGNILTGSNKIFFFLGRSIGNECYENVVATHLHPSQITQSVIRRLLEYSSSAFILRSNDIFATRISDLMTEKMKSLIVTSNGNIILDRTNTRRLVNDIQRALPNGGYIITILTNDEDILAFYELICNNYINYPTYTILNTLFNENLIEKILQKAPDDNKQCLNGFMVFDSYFESLGNSELNTVGVPTLATTCNKDIHIQIGDDHKIIGDYESAYSAITFWKGVIRKVNSFVLEDMSEMYHYTVSIPADTVELNPNNYFNRRIYSGTINGQGEIVVDWSPTQKFTPLIFNQFDEDEIGLICDFYDKENKGKNYNTNPIIITFFHEKDLGGRTEKYNALLIDLIVKEINDVGGILGRQIAANHSWVTISDAYRNARAIYEVGKSNIMFGCMTSECRTEISRYLKEKDPLFFFTGRDDGFECQDNLIVGGLSINQKSDVLMEYIQTLGIKKLYIIGSDRNSSNTELFVIEQSVKRINDEYNNNEKDEVVEIVGHSFLSPFNKQYVEQMLKDIESKLDKLNRVAIINLYFASENTQFISGYIDSSITSSTVIFFMKYDPLDLGEEVIKKLTGSYVVTSYSPSVTNTASGAFQYLMTAEYQDSIELNEILENTYSTIYTWKQAVEYSMSYCGNNCEWPGNDYVKLSLKYISYDSPSGPIKTEDNNQISKDVYIFQLSDTSLIQVFPQQGIEYIVEGKMTYKNSKDECLFSKNTVYYELNEAFRWVSITFSILNGVSSVFVAAIVYFFRHTRIIKSASPLFLYYALISLVILAIMGDIFTLLADSEVICAARIWGLGLSINLLFSIMFSKAWRIHKLFNNKQLQKVKVSNVMLLKMIGLILAIQIIYLIIWQIVAPSKPTLSFSSGYSTYLDDVYMRECTSNSIFVAIELVAVFLLFFWGAKLAWGVRNASAEFNESMSLMATIAIMIIMGVILVPLDYLMSSETDTLMLLRSLGIELGVFIILLVQFGSKVMFLYTTELSTTFTSGTFGSRSSNSNSLENRNRQLKVAASRGRFRIFPDVFYFGDFGLATISEPQHFYDEGVGMVGSCYSRRFDKSNSISARRAQNQRGSESTTPLCSARINTPKEE